MISLEERAVHSIVSTWTADQCDRLVRHTMKQRGLATVRDRRERARRAAMGDPRFAQLVATYCAQSDTYEYKGARYRLEYYLDTLTVRRYVQSGTCQFVDTCKVYRDGTVEGRMAFDPLVTAFAVERVRKRLRCDEETTD